MKFEDFETQFKSREETQLNILDKDENETGVIIFCKTLESPAGEQAKKDCGVDDSVYFNHQEDGTPLYKISGKPKPEERKLMSKLIFDVKGLEGWKFTPNNVQKIMNDSLWVGLQQQLWNHLRVAGNGQEKDS